MGEDRKETQESLNHYSGIYKAHLLKDQPPLFLRYINMCSKIKITLPELE